MKNSQIVLLAHGMKNHEFFYIYVLLSEISFFYFRLKKNIFLLFDEQLCHFLQFTVETSVNPKLLEFKKISFTVSKK